MYNQWSVLHMVVMSFLLQRYIALVFLLIVVLS